jgi:hypothetical protein
MSNNEELVKISRDIIEFCRIRQKELDEEFPGRSVPLAIQHVVEFYRDMSSTAREFLIRNGETNILD